MLIRSIFLAFFLATLSITYKHAVTTAMKNVKRFTTEITEDTEKTKNKSDFFISVLSVVISVFDKLSIYSQELSC